MITSIENHAFSGSSLTSVYCIPTTPPTAITDYSGEWSAFHGNASERKIYVSTASVEVYKTAEYWSDYASYIEGYYF